VSSGGEGIFQARASALCQEQLRQELWPAFTDLEARFSSPGCAGSWGWPQWALRPGDSGRENHRVKGAGRMQVINVRSRRLFQQSTWLSTDHPCAPRKLAAAPPGRAPPRGQLHASCPGLQAQNPARHSAPAQRAS